MNSMRAVSQLSSSVRHFYYPWAWSVDQLRANVPDAMSKLIIGSPYPPLTDPRMARMLKDLKAEQARGNSLANPDDMDQKTTDAWVALQALFAVTKGLKTITPQTITNALNSSRNVKVGSFVPPWTPTAVGPIAAYPRSSNPSCWYVGFKNNSPYLVINHPVTVPNALAGKF
jgi:hypothetical protein